MAPNRTDGRGQSRPAGAIPIRRKIQMAIYELDGVQPQIHETAWIAESAEVIGNVHIGADCSIWPGVVIRGDNEPIHIGDGSNIQDNSVLHSDYDMPLTVGRRVTVGHKVILHGCTVGDGSLIGMGATVLNKAVIGNDSLVGAGALVTEGKAFPDRTLVVGSPAVAKRELTPEAIGGLARSADSYIANGRRYRAGLKRIG